jgi:cation diffusion facilitator family transporter
MSVYKEVKKVNVIVLVLNLLVAFGKIIMGYAINSMSMEADGFHSLTDASSNIIGLIGVYLSYRPRDKEHPYGHRKIETLVTLVIAIMLFAVCYEIFSAAIGRFNHPTTVEDSTYGFLVMLITISINMFVAAFERHKGKELGSDFLISDSMHTTSDIYVSLSVILGLVFTRLDIQWADVIVALFIGLMIGRAGYKILCSGIKVLLDTAVIDADEIAALVEQQEGIKSCHKIRTRGKQDDISVDLHVLVDKDMHIYNAHKLADAIEAKLREEYSGITDVTIHIEPS